MAYQNQVLEGVQSRIKSRLDSDLNLENQLKAKQAEGLHAVIWDPSPAVTDEQRQRAADALLKLYPNNKDLITRIRDASSKVFGFLKAPPLTQEQEKGKSQDVLNQVTSGATPNGMATGAQPAAAPQIDPNVAATYSNMLPPPPAMNAAPVQPQVDPNVAATYTGMLPPPPVMEEQQTTVIAPEATPAAAGTTPPLQPPPYQSIMGQEAGAMARGKHTLSRQEMIEDEARKADTARETKRLELEQTHTNAMTLAERQKQLEQQYNEHFVASGRFLINQQDGSFRELESEDEAKRTADVVNYRYYEAQETGSGRKPMSFEEWIKAREKARAEAGADPYMDVVLAGSTYKVPRSLANTKTRAELEQMAANNVFLPAPRTIYNTEGMPNVGGMEGFSTSAPPTIDAATQQQLGAWKNNIDQIETKIIPRIEEQIAFLGPAFGRGAKFLANNLGGYGLSTEQEATLIELRRQLMSEAFGEGGKQLTPTELGVFEGLLPNQNDTWSQAMLKAKLSAQFLRDRYAARLWAMPANQRRQMKDLPQAPSRELSRPIAEAILGMANGDAKRAAKIAEELGYEVK